MSPLVVFSQSERLFLWFDELNSKFRLKEVMEENTLIKVCVTQMNHIQHQIIPNIPGETECF